MYHLVSNEDPELWIEHLKPDSKLSPQMCRNLKQYWKERVAVPGSDTRKIFADVVTIASTISLSRDLFRVKATERRDNILDYVGLLDEKGVKSARNTIHTSLAFYVLRARELGEGQL
jgi:hypothetical protein